MNECWGLNFIDIITGLKVLENGEYVVSNGLTIRNSTYSDWHKTHSCLECHENPHWWGNFQVSNFYPPVILYQISMLTVAIITSFIGYIEFHLTFFIRNIIILYKYLLYDFIISLFTVQFNGSVVSISLQPQGLQMPGLPAHHQLPELDQTHAHQVSDAIQPSHPLSFSSPPAFNLSQHQGLFQWVSSSHEVAIVLAFQLQHQSFQWTSRTDLL